MSRLPTVLVTCGPASVPIDAVRRITNHSTGELGTLLSERLAREGFDVICLRGEMASYPPPQNVRVVPFATNVSLLDGLSRLPAAPDVILHAAALSDFELASIEGAEAAGKIRSDAPELKITLRPAEKILPRLRGLFPGAVIVGWKYEVDGTREDVLARAHAQIESARSDACVANGPAYGDGFGFVCGDDVRHLPDKPALGEHLAGWIKDYSPKITRQS